MVDAPLGDALPALTIFGLQVLLGFATKLTIYAPTGLEMLQKGGLQVVVEKQFEPAVNGQLTAVCVVTSGAWLHVSGVPVSSQSHVQLLVSLTPA
jgi:hypothetical protein